MASINFDAIINGTPYKRINNAYRDMKENYNEESADKFYNVYSQEDVVSILESSRLIFSEPYKGLGFYKSIILNKDLPLFTYYESELNKIDEYIDTITELEASSEQIDLYKDLSSKIREITESNKETRLIASYIKEKVDPDFENALIDTLYRKDIDGSSSLFESVDNVILYTYGPYVSSILTESDLSDKILLTFPCDGRSTFDEYVERALYLNKLTKDISYMEAVGSLKPDCRIFIKEYGNSSIKNTLNGFNTVSDEEANAYIYDSPENAINALFEAAIEDEIFKEDRENAKKELDDASRVAYEKTSDLLLFEYTHTDNKKDLVGYSLFDENETLENASQIIINKMEEMGNSSFFEETDDDVDDIDDDKDDNKKDDKEEKKDSSNQNSSSVTQNKKVIKPKAKNLPNKIQFAAQDMEVKGDKAIANAKQHGQEITNAAKAVTKLPKTVFDDMKNTVRKLDQMDDERRKKFMTEPGFRKHASKNLKLAVLYGSVASLKLSLIPYTMLFRHFSKQKDKRMRNELILELNTELEICNAKIEDAQQRDDKEEKYRLIRIKNNLQREIYRVTANSKYI